MVRQPDPGFPPHILGFSLLTLSPQPPPNKESGGGKMGNKKAPKGAFLLGWRRGWDCSPHPWGSPLRGPPGAVPIRSRRIGRNRWVNYGWFEASLHQQIKRPRWGLFICWRRGWDSSPRYARAHNGFRDRPVRPLRHLSITLRFNTATSSSVKARPVS